MSQEELKELLSKVHNELAGIEDLDDEAKSLLGTVMSDLQGVLGESSTVDESHGFIDRFRDATQDFEEDHPQLTDAIGQVVTALSRLGI
jgi:hypothetical protein